MSLTTHMELLDELVRRLKSTEVEQEKLISSTVEENQSILTCIAHMLVFPTLTEEYKCKRGIEHCTYTDAELTQVTTPSVGTTHTKRWTIVYSALTRNKPLGVTSIRIILPEVFNTIVDNSMLDVSNKIENIKKELGKIVQMIKESIRHTFCKAYPLSDSLENSSKLMDILVNYAAKID